MTNILHDGFKPAAGKTTRCKTHDSGPDLTLHDRRQHAKNNLPTTGSLRQLTPHRPRVPARGDSTVWMAQWVRVSKVGDSSEELMSCCVIATCTNHRQLDDARSQEWHCKCHPARNNPVRRLSPKARDSVNLHCLPTTTLLFKTGCAVQKLFSPSAGFARISHKFHHHIQHFNSSRVCPSSAACTTTKPRVGVLHSTLSTTST